MDFKEFTKTAAEGLEKRAPGRRVRMHEVVKNNHVKLIGITLEGPHTKVFPILYMEGYYDGVCGGDSMEETIDRMWADYRQREEGAPECLSGITNWEQAKCRLAVKLIHYGENEELLQTAPHEKFLDLAVVYYYIAGAGEDGPQMALVKNNLLAVWGIDGKELKEAAYASHVRYCRTEIKSLGGLIEEMTGMPLKGKPKGQMYVVTNQWKAGGAAAMLFPEELKKLAMQLGSDLYILPSSVHEIIALPAAMGDPAELARLVKEVNRNCVCPEERLSDHVYRYCMESGQIQIA